MLRQPAIRRQTPRVLVQCRTLLLQHRGEVTVQDRPAQARRRSSGGKRNRDRSPYREDRNPYREDRTPLREDRNPYREDLQKGSYELPKSPPSPQDPLKDHQSQPTPSVPEEREKKGGGIGGWLSSLWKSWGASVPSEEPTPTAPPPVPAPAPPPRPIKPASPPPPPPPSPPRPTSTCATLPYPLKPRGDWRDLQRVVQKVMDLHFGGGRSHVPMSYADACTLGDTQLQVYATQHVLAMKLVAGGGDTLTVMRSPYVQATRPEDPLVEFFDERVKPCLKDGASFKTLRQRSDFVEALLYVSFHSAEDLHRALVVELLRKGDNILRRRGLERFHEVTESWKPPIGGALLDHYHHHGDESKSEGPIPTSQQTRYITSESPQPHASEEEGSKRHSHTQGYRSREGTVEDVRGPQREGVQSAHPGGHGGGSFDGGGGGGGGGIKRSTQQHPTTKEATDENWIVRSIDQAGRQ